MKLIVNSILICIVFLFINIEISAQSDASLNQNLLSFSNSFVELQYDWNNGQLTSSAFICKKDGENLLKKSSEPSFNFQSKLNLKDSSFKTRQVSESSLTEAYLEAEVFTDYGQFKLKRIFRIYNNSMAIACDNYIWISTDVDQSILDLFSEPISLEKLKVPYSFPKAEAIEFFDRTDHNNNLVKKEDVFAFRHEINLKGNILKLISPVSGGSKGLFVIKEAPCSFVQLAYPGYDFKINKNIVNIDGIGISDKDLVKGEWTKLYGTVIGCYDGTDLGFMKAIKSYQKSLRKIYPERDEMIMMNTWGDRNRDASIGEDFLKGELDACEELGISHFQIDDGWQQGLSMNSAEKKGDKWDLWAKEDWQPHTDRLPNGLKPIVEYAAQKDIQLGLWFHPSNHNSYENWEVDANIMIDLYKQFNIRYFKIDGIMLPNKKADHHLGLLFEKVSKESDGEIVINLDATAGDRTGYHYKNTYGNIFLENRYTDWQNYYPHWTLRNLWQLSAYVPSRNFQIEFLNKWRNAKIYGDDPLAPANIPFDYQFAITMMAQPLAWFEGTGLPKEDFNVAPIIKKYRSLQAEIHSGDIYPIGDEPSGTSWTGFQSELNENTGYILVFRENNQKNEMKVKTYLPAKNRYTFKAIVGSAESFAQQVDEDNRIQFKLPAMHTFALYKYVKE